LDWLGLKCKETLRIYGYLEVKFCNLLKINSLGEIHICKAFRHLARQGGFTASASITEAFSGSVAFRSGRPPLSVMAGSCRKERNPNARSTRNEFSEYPKIKKTRRFRPECLAARREHCGVSMEWLSATRSTQRHSPVDEYPFRLH